MNKQFYIRVKGKILGPYSIEQLKVLRSRGQFSKANEVSEDRRKWFSASELVSIFETKSNEAKGSPFQTDSSSSVNDAKLIISDDMWYYLDDDKRVGPVTAVELTALLQSGSVLADCLVWREGLEEWVLASSLSQFAGIKPIKLQKSRKTGVFSRPFYIFVSVALVSVCFIVSYMFNYSLITLITNPGAIQSLEGGSAEQQLAGAVGLVVCGWHGILQDGTLVEEPISTGTCFVISRDGYALTNAHVISQVAKNFRAKLQLDKIKKELLIDLEPRIWVFINSKLYYASIVSVSDNYDLGIIKIDRQFNSFFRLAASDTGLRGQKVFALGFPAVAQTSLSEEEAIENFRRANTTKAIRSYFKSRDLEFSLTIGAVSKVTKETEGRVWIQHNADINPGNSGGPLATTDGVVHGINTRRAIDPSTQEQGSGVFFSLTTGQLRSEISQHVPVVSWK